jgi:cysteinyl-tRNA synthetase
VEAKAAKKAAQAAEEQRKRVEKLEKGRVPPTEMFRPPHEDKYGSWDDKGLPLTDAEGKDLSKNQASKLSKLYDQRVKAHQEFLKWQAEQGSA